MNNRWLSHSVVLLLSVGCFASEAQTFSDRLSGAVESLKSCAEALINSKQQTLSTEEPPIEVFDVGQRAQFFEELQTLIATANEDPKALLKVWTSSPNPDRGPKGPKVIPGGLYSLYVENFVSPPLLDSEHTGVISNFRNNSPDTNPENFEFTITQSVEKGVIYGQRDLMGFQAEHKGDHSYDRKTVIDSITVLRHVKTIKSKRPNILKRIKNRRSPKRSIGLVENDPSIDGKKLIPYANSGYRGIVVAGNSGYFSGGSLTPSYGSIFAKEYEDYKTGNPWYSWSIGTEDGRFQVNYSGSRSLKEIRVYQVVRRLQMTPELIKSILEIEEGS